MRSCKTCERRNKEAGGCLVFNIKPNPCWAWTDDPKWHKKIRKDTKKYKQYKNYKIGKYWG